MIAQFVNTHSSEKCIEKRTGDIIDKVKALRKLGKWVWSLTFDK